MKYWIKILKGIRHSFSGIKMAVREEQAVRLEIVFFSPFILLAFILDIKATEKILLLFPIFLVFVCEFLNTALEKTIDELSQKKVCHSFKFAKDVASAAVFLMILMTLLTWILIIGDTIDFYPLIKS